MIVTLELVVYVFVQLKENKQNNFEIVIGNLCFELNLKYIKPLRNISASHIV